LTKKLYAQAIAWAAANWEITLIVAAVVAVAAAFVWAWNKFDWFRKGVVEGLKFLLKWWGFLLRAVGFVAEAFLQIVTGPMRLFLKALGFISPEAKKASKDLDKLPRWLAISLITLRLKLKDLLAQLMAGKIKRLTFLSLNCLVSMFLDLKTE
jgi:hypothetical protein